MQDLLVSIHIPKTAGVSFGAALREAFGKAHIRRDYFHARDFERLHQKGVDPLEIHKRWLRRNPAMSLAMYLAGPAFVGADVHCVHGHFAAVKYLPAVLHRRVRFITWVRHPFDRLVSTYYFWRRLKPENIRDPFVNRVLDEDWSLEDLCLCPAMTDYQSAHFSGFPLRRLAFIGVTEHYDDDLDWFSRRFFGRPLTSVRLNTTAASQARRDDASLADLKRRVEDHHRADMALYRHALALRAERAPPP